MRYAYALVPNAKPSISIVVPLLNEAAVLPDLIPRLLRLQVHELILVDGGSEDQTPDILEQHGLTCVPARRGRARQLNVGAAQASGDVLLFLHADTILPEGFDTLLKGGWGRFDVQFDTTSLAMRTIAFFMNWRSRWSGIATGDQAMFVQRSLFEQVGGFPDQPIMEDIELSKNLKQLVRPHCITAKVTTSARRWQSNGVWSTVVLMWRLRWAYYRGVPAQQLQQLYLDAR